jgi:methyl-accepting chemotaxis protein
VHRFLSRFKLIHQFALLAIAFAMLSGCGGAVIWMKINELQIANTKIIEAQFPSRLALAEAKGSAAAFASLAYRALAADPSQLIEIKGLIGDEEQRFRHWLQNVKDDDPQTANDLTGIEARFNKLIDFLKHFASPNRISDKEPRDFQLEYRFGPLRDDLDASLNHLSNALGRAAQDYVEYTQHVQSVELLSTVELIALGCFMLFICTTLWAAFGIARPIHRLAGTTRKLAEGHTNIDIVDRGYAEEICVMSRALTVFRDTALLTRELETENLSARKRAAAALAAERRRVAEIFQHDLMEAVMIVSKASGELQKNATFLRDRAIETDLQARMVVKISDQNIETIGSLSRSSTQLSHTAGTMNDQLVDAAKIATLAAADGRSTSQSAHDLVSAVDAISKIADFITNVSYKINLLALNATIEAARCGEMGRGFAVVAAEVKHLAHATSDAAADIGRQLSAVKSATDQVVQAIDVTVDGISRIGEMAGVLESAHNSKEIATRDITGCVDSVVENAKHVSEVIGNVSAASGETQLVAEVMLAATRELAEQAERLLTRSQDFCEKIALPEAA